MRRSAGFGLAAIEAATLAWWSLGLRFETGFDALQYHRMTAAIVANGYAPWALSPLSYLGLYPGSDSSGVPFLAATITELAGAPIALSAVIYDAVLLLILSLGLFMLTRRLTGRTDLALLSMLMGSLAYGIWSTLYWAIDERSFNVALTPIVLFFLLSLSSRSHPDLRGGNLVVLGLTCGVMLVSHLSFLLLLPFFVVVPLVFEVVRGHHAGRRTRRASVAYFGMVSLTPLLLLATLSQTGVLSSSGLEYQLESSALFSGTSPLVFFANAMIFLGTRLGLVNIVFLAIGMIYLISRPSLPANNILLGAILIAGFLGLPLVTYSKDLLTPVCVLVGTIGLGHIVRKGPRAAMTFAVATTFILAGSVAFNYWNFARTSRSADAIYWALPGVTSEAQSANLWSSDAGLPQGCVYGNNAALVQQVTTGIRQELCTGLAIDLLINSGTSEGTDSRSIQVVFNGFSGTPSDWFTSPQLEKVAADFARLPTLSFAAGRALLREYNISYIIVDLKRPDQTPLYSYEGSVDSLFFADLWATHFPVYRTTDVAIFRTT